MNRWSKSLTLTVICAGSLAAAGCISLLPKTKPTDLYRFGQTAPASSEPVQGGTVGVLRATSTFQRESAGDRILTITGGQVAYVAETRWVAPAVTLWDQAVLAAFDADGGRARLVSRGEPATAPYILRLDVRNFEARYDSGPKAAPIVVIRVRAALTSRDKGQLTERIFEARATATDNRVSAIVPAYDKAVGEVLKDIVAWTNELAAPV